MKRGLDCLDGHVWRDHYAAVGERLLTIMVRGDMAYGTKKVITTCVEQGAEFSYR